MKLLYGPVSSWRLGRSLGVDPLGGARKRCTFDCIYCQLGPTPNGPVLRDAWVEPAVLADELRATQEVAANYITFSGLGEPTLASNLGELIQVVRESRRTPVAVLTNASLLGDPTVRAALRLADYVIAKVDAVKEEVFRQVNRPRIPCAIEEIVEDIQAFRETFRGRLALQMMFIQANVAQAKALAELAWSLMPDEVQLNTPLRPSPTPPLARADMAEIAAVFHGLPVLQVHKAMRVPVTPLDPAETRRRRPEARNGMEGLVA
jgi:wyosine [tRNA(Phe)-imidazoG37] synthetase (radical SAM superfamily)